MSGDFLALTDRALFVAGGLGVALLSYGLSFRVYDKGRPRSPLSAIYYDLAPNEGRFGFWLVALCLPLAVIVYLFRQLL